MIFFQLFFKVISFFVSYSCYVLRFINFYFSHKILFIQVFTTFSILHKIQLFFYINLPSLPPPPSHFTSRQFAPYPLPHPVYPPPTFTERGRGKMG